MAATIEAITQEIPVADIRLLSIETGAVVKPNTERAQPPFTVDRTRSSIFADLRELSTLILDDPPDVASYIAYTITRDPESKNPFPDRVVRMSPLIAPQENGSRWSPYEPMSEKDFTYLCDVPMDALEGKQVKAIDDYCELWLANRAPNQPIRMNGEDLKPEIGQASFSEALNAWKMITV